LLQVVTSEDQGKISLKHLPHASGTATFTSPVSLQQFNEELARKVGLAGLKYIVATYVSICNATLADGRLIRQLQVCGSSTVSPLS